MKEGCIWIFFMYMDEKLMVHSDYHTKLTLSMQDVLRIE